MVTPKLIFILLLAGMSGASCVPRAQHVETENRLQVAQARLEEASLRLQSLENEKKECLAEGEALRLKIQTDLDACKKLNARLSESSKNLAEQAQKLKREAEKHRSVVNLQSRVITLLDDTRRSIETSLKEQIAAQGIQLVESEINSEWF